MGSVMDRLQPLDGDMGVELRARETSVTKQLLDGSQISTPLEQMRRRTVPQAVRPDVGGAGYRAHGVVHRAPGGSWIEPAASGAEEERRWGPRSEQPGAALELPPA